MTGSPSGSDDDPIVPDDADWTWVITRACPDCGFDPAEVVPARVGERTRDLAAQWVAVLDAPTEQLAARPSPERWSALEYACHVRDVFALFDERLALMLAEDAPRFANWDQDATAREQRYGESDPAEVAAAVAARGAALADRFDSVSGSDWERTGHRSDGASFTVDTFATYFLHDPVHHLWDVATARTAAHRG